jgi:hypothetical protein
MEGSFYGNYLCRFSLNQSLFRLLNNENHYVITLDELNNLSYESNYFFDRVEQKIIETNANGRLLEATTTQSNVIRYLPIIGTLNFQLPNIPYVETPQYTVSNLKSSFEDSCKFLNFVEYKQLCQSNLRISVIDLLTTKLKHDGSIKQYFVLSNDQQLTIINLTFSTF